MRRDPGAGEAFGGNLRDGAASADAGGWGGRFDWGKKQERPGSKAGAALACGTPITTRATQLEPTGVLFPRLFRSR